MAAKRNKRKRMKNVIKIKQESRLSISIVIDKL